MKQLNLVMSLPHGMCTATSLGIEGYARHRSPGSGQVFQGRAIFVDLRLENGKPAFSFRDEGGWRDAKADTEMALAESETKRTKTALSNNAFSIIPMQAHQSVWLVKTGGHVLKLESGGETVRFASHDWRLDMSPDDLAQAVGLPKQPNRQPRCYMVLAPIELVILSNLTPPEYAWYATHRSGKLFRQVLFTEIRLNPRYLLAERSFEDARAELMKNPRKKTKTVYLGNAYDKIPFTTWVGYDAPAEGGLYCGDREHVMVWRFPAKIPTTWSKADG